MSDPIHAHDWGCLIEGCVFMVKIGMAICDLVLNLELRFMGNVFDMCWRNWSPALTREEEWSCFDGILLSIFEILDFKLMSRQVCEFFSLDTKILGLGFKTWFEVYSKERWRWRRKKGRKWWMEVLQNLRPLMRRDGDSEWTRLSSLPGTWSGSFSRNRCQLFLHLFLRFVWFITISTHLSCQRDLAQGKQTKQGIHAMTEVK